MSDPRFEGPERLEGYKILPTPEGFDAYTLVLRIGSREIEFVADHQILLKLADSIQKHVVPPKTMMA